MTARQVVTLVLILLAFAFALWVKEVYGPQGIQ
jgi:hypothetical protein